MDKDSMFGTAALIAAVENLNSPHKWLMDQFFGEVNTSDDESVAVEVERRGRRLAPYVSPLHEGRVLEHGSRQVKIYKPAYLKPKMITKAGDHLKRDTGEQLLGVKSAAERAANQLAKDISELTDTIHRRIEVMCRDGLVDARIVIKGDGFDEVIDFGRDPLLAKKLTGTSKWTDNASDPLATIKEYCDLVLQKSGHSVDTLVMGRSASSAFLASDKVQKVLDNRRISLGQIDPRQLPKGVVYLGSLSGPFVDIYGYTDWYVDPVTGTEASMIPEDNVVFIASGARRVLHYGAIQDYDAGLVPMPIFAKSWVQDDPSARFLLLQSAPLPVPVEVDATANVNVIG